MNPSDVLERFADLPFDLELELGNVVMTIGEIFELREGTVLRTDHPAGGAFTLRAGGVELAMAEVVVVDDSVSVRIKKLVEKEKTPAGEDGSN
jgi:flagellar motor switch protein FliN